MIIEGTAGNELLIGTAGDDTIDGMGGQDTLVGGAGNDVLRGDQSNDTAIFFGPRGDYTFTYFEDDFLTTDVTLHVHDKVVSRDGDDTAFNISWFQFSDGRAGFIELPLYITMSPAFHGDYGSFVGTRQDDTMIGGPEDDWFNGGFGDDLIDGGAGVDSVGFFSTNNAVLSVFSLESDAVINLALGFAHSAQGNDTLVSIENVTSGFGNDLIIGSNAANSLEGGGGNDTINGGEGSDTLGGSGGFDWLTGGPGDDFMTNTSGLDWVTSVTVAVYSGSRDEYTLSPGLKGAFVLHDTQPARDGADDAGGVQLFQFADGMYTADLVRNGRGDYHFGTAAAETIEGTDSRDAIQAGAGADVVHAGADADMVWGGDGDDELDGGSGNDVLDGGEGSDTVLGGTGDDVLLGGAGDDRFAEEPGNDTVFGGAGLDLVTYSGPRNSYELRADVNRIAVSSGAFTDSLTEVERVKFDDVSVAFDLEGSAGEVARLIGALIDRSQLGNRHLVGLGLNALDHGYTTREVASLIIDTLYPGEADGGYLAKIYHNITGADPSGSDLGFMTGLLQSGALSRVDFGMIAVNSDWNAEHIALVYLERSGLEYLL